MKITLLCENSVGPGCWDKCLAEWGLSAFVEYKDKKILFDMGTTDVYVKNAKTLGIDLKETDFVVFSHYHIDHTGGLKFHPFQNKVKLIVHPDIPEKLPVDDQKILTNDFEVVTSVQPFEMTEGAFYLGQIPRKTAFEKGQYEEDEMNDDSAVAFKTDQGAVVLAGCSHAGICNICEYAKEITGQDLYAVIGGFHLFEDDPAAIDGTIEYFKKENPKYLLPMHCVVFPVLARMQSEFGFDKYSSGDTIEL